MKKLSEALGVAIEAEDLTDFKEISWTRDSKGFLVDDKGERIDKDDHFEEEDEDDNT